MPTNGVNTKLVATNELLSELSGLNSAIDASIQSQITAFAQYASSFNDLSDAINSWQAIWGEYQANTTLTWLQKIAECICGLVEGYEPLEASPNGCTSPIPSLSERMVTDETYPGRGFIEWDSTLPQGMELTSDTFPSLSTGIEVTLTADTTYYLWVQSACHTFKTNPDALSEYPTNKWIAIDGPNSIAVNLPTGCAGTAFMCLNPDQGFVDCVTRVSSITESVHSTYDDSNRVRLSVPLDGLGLTLTDTVAIAGSTFTSDSGQTWTTSDMSGVQIHWVAGINIRVFYRLVGVNVHVEQMNSDNPSHTVPGPTDWFGIDNWQDPIGNTSAPFTVEICPPSPA